MMNASRDAASFHARMSALPEVSAFVAEICRAAELPQEMCLKLTLLVEELFTNTIEHGHGGDSDAPVHLAFELAPGRIALAYEDTAPPHNPFATVVAPDAQQSVEERPVGGLGIRLVSAIATDIQYRRDEGRNRISLVIAALSR